MKYLDEQRRRHEIYKDFLDFWQSIPVTWHEFHEPQKKFMFDFLFRLIVSCWDDFNYAETLIIKSKSREYLEHPEDDLADLIKDWRQSLPKFSVHEERRRVESAETVQLFEELINCEDVCTEYLLDSGVSFTPFRINYPPEFAFQILKHMGYEKGMYPET